jgi:nucleoid-associated protein YgaU
MRGSSTMSIAVAQSDPAPPPGPGPHYGSGRYGSMSPPPMTYASGRRDYGGPPEPPPSLRNPVAADAIPERRPVEREQPGGTYKVVPGDNYWKISEKLYGTGAYFKALAEHNRDHNLRDDRLQPGAKIEAPEVAELEKKYADLCPKASHHRGPGSRFAQVSSSGRMAGRRTYKVEAGDTLYDIAKHELGNPARWGEIYQLNREVLGEDYDYLPRGLELALPEGGRRDTLTQRPDDSLRR